MEKESFKAHPSSRALYIRVSAVSGSDLGRGRGRKERWLQALHPSTITATLHGLLNMSHSTVRKLKKQCVCCSKGAENFSCAFLLKCKWKGSKLRTAACDTCKCPAMVFPSGLRGELLWFPHGSFRVPHLTLATFSLFYFCGSGELNPGPRAC